MSPQIEERELWRVGFEKERLLTISIVYIDVVLLMLMVLCYNYSELGIGHMAYMLNTTDAHQIELAYHFTALRALV